MSMLKLISIDVNSKYLLDICELIVRYGGIMFSYNVNPVSVFFDNLISKRSVCIAGLKNDDFLAFINIFNFQKMSQNMFSCYIYGASKRKSGKEIDIFMRYILADLKKQGCVAVRFETRECNLPMRNMANRLGFQKIGILSKTAILKNKFINSILYEKLL